MNIHIHVHDTEGDDADAVVKALRYEMNRSGPYVGVEASREVGLDNVGDHRDAPSETADDVGHRDGARTPTPRLRENFFQVGSYGLQVLDRLLTRLIGHGTPHSSVADTPKVLRRGRSNGRFRRQCGGEQK